MPRLVKEESGFQVVETRSHYLCSVHYRCRSGRGWPLFLAMPGSGVGRLGYPDVSGADPLPSKASRVSKVWLSIY